MFHAFFIDYYGTLVCEDNEKIDLITQKIFETGCAQTKTEIGEFWWKQFKGMCDKASGENFRRQRELEYLALKNTIEKYNSTEDAEVLCEMLFEYWRNPLIFPETKEFFRRYPVPIYVVSNIDTDDIEAAFKNLDLHPDGVFTSEDAKSYKPNKEIFELALEKTGLSADEVLHIGDSLSCDIEGAKNAGIDVVWLNRGKKECPAGVKEAQNLIEVLERYLLVEELA